MLTRYLVIFYLILWSPFLICSQTDDLYLFIDENTIIGKISGNQVFTSDKTVSYTLQGNIIFNGSEPVKDNILFIVNAKDIFSKKASIVYQDDSKTVQYIAINGNFYYGDFPINDDLEKLLMLEKVNDSTIIVKNGSSGIEIGTIAGKPTNASSLVVSAYLYIMHYDLHNMVLTQIQNFQDSEGNNTGGIVRLRNTDNPYYEWKWDGKYFKPAYGNRPEDEWQFDGKYLRQVWNLDPKSEWVWENDILKPTWENNPEQQWYWENNTLRTYWNPKAEETWILEESIMRPMWSYDPYAEWEIIGNVPLPVLTLIILGIADRP